jgi:hypothetical protein
MRHAPDQGAESDLAFQAGQWCAQAGIDTFAKGQMFIDLARNVQRFRIGKVLGIGKGKSFITLTRARSPYPRRSHQSAHQPLKWRTAPLFLLPLEAC